MFGPPTYSKKTRYPEYIYQEYEKTAKYHQAAYTFFVVGIIYAAVFYLTMPPHDFGSLLESFVKEKIPAVDDILAGIGKISYSAIVITLAIFVEISFLGLSYFIYKEYRTFVIILTLIYAVRLVIATATLYIEGVFFAVKYILPLIVITFYMLARAAWNLRP